MFVVCSPLTYAPNVDPPNLWPKASILHLIEKKYDAYVMKYSNIKTEGKRERKRERERERERGRRDRERKK